MQPDIQAQLDGYVRSGQFVGAIPRSPASPTAQSDRGGGTLGIENIRRGHLALVTKTASNISLTSTSFTRLSPELEGSLVVSGRPCVATITGVITAPSGFTVSLYMDGTEVTGKSGILELTGTGSGVTAPFVAIWPFTPSSGQHLFTVVAKVPGGVTTIKTSQYSATLIVTEQ
jgi:hypothetical protein